ncbi:complement C3-like [Oculina patagonica]
MVFIQTDKPIYTPGQTVRIRVIPLDFDMKPSKRKISLVVMNPKGNRVQQWKDLDTSTGFISKQLILSDAIIQGKWTVAAFYGHQDIHNKSVRFEVKEYVLPKFSIKLSVPPYILKTDRYIKVKITARYTYKEPVVGAADVRLSIRGLNRQVYSFAAHQVLLDRSGAATIEEPVNSIHDLPGYLWFPENWCLLVQADVVERATGNRESVVDKSYPFKSSPYLIQFKNTPKYFKPGLPFVVKVVVTYPNKQPARSLPMKITAIGINGNEQKNLNRINSNAADTTNEYGEAELMVDTCRDCHNIKITVKTDDQTLSVSQNAVANFVAEAFHSGNAPLIMLRQVTPGKVGWKMDCECFRSGDYAAALLSCAVVSRGRILFHYTIDSFDGVVKSWSFLVTPEMSPLARLIVYYIDSNERVVSDSILLKIEESLPTKVDFPDAIKINAIGTRVHLNEIEKIPGQMYEFRIKAPQGTRLGLLGVDESVYLSRNEDRLTKERIFKTAKELDLGCGAGGGKDSQDTFKNAGVVLMTNSFVSDGRKHYGCDEDGSRKKRSLFEDDFGVSDTTFLEDSAIPRSYYPETWIYDEKVVGPSGFATLFATIPDTITTWVTQAVAINNKTGLGLATPLRIVSKKEYFVSLKMPSLVKMGEQISLLATAFNNGEEETRVKIYLKGSADFCSFATADKLSLIGMVIIPPNDARSVTVPIFAKRAGKVQVEVSAVFQIKMLRDTYVNAAGDTVRRKLLVVPEGAKSRPLQSFTLDPKVRQLDIIELKVPTTATPGSTEVVLYLSGNPSFRNLTVDLRVKVVTEIEGVDEDYHITPENRLLRKEIKVPMKAFGGKLVVQTKGTGVGLLEVELRFIKNCKFDLITTVKEIKELNSQDLFGTRKNKGRKIVKGCKGKNKNKKRCKNNDKHKDKDMVKSINLKVCTRKKRQEKAGGMCIMDIGILNGFIPERKSLQKLKQNNTVPELDKLEVSDRSLVIYFREIPSDRELCVDVRFDRKHYEGTVQAVPVNVYDYYEPDQSCSVFYGPDKFTPLKLGVCDAGSSSCNCTKVPKRIGCVQLLRNLLKNPPRYTHIAINIRLSKARYRCRAGYVLSGKDMRTCKEGRWSEEKEPKCMGACRRPKHIPHAKFIGSSFKFKDKLRYICDKGYTLKGSSIRQCGENRRWSKAPSCLKDYSSCGESSADTRSLLGGRKIMSNRGWWPWQIAIYRSSVEGGEANELFHCGGTLISRQWVLTVANCFYRGSISSSNRSLYFVKAGIHNLARKEKSQQKMSLKAIFVHKNYNSSLYLNDIALVKLDQPVKLTNFVRTVCLQEKNEGDLAIPQTHGIATGWGITRALKLGEPFHRRDLSKVLHYSSLKVQNDDFCSNRSMPFSINSTVTFCAGDGQRRRGTCTGDGGGAFVREAQRGDDNRWAWVATGIVSWGKGCGQKDEPGYYTRVYPFIDWIKKTMDKN